uniref:Cysteine-rich protein 1 n=1 Tax=Ascaris suum TaxID=6253 RepID=F1LFV0_ASCSU
MPFKPIEHPKCPKCGKSVYAAEEMVAGGYKFHKFCFKCSLCNKLLDSCTVAEHGSELFCKQCHGRKYGPKGVGFGLGAGALTMDDGARFGNTSNEMGSDGKSLANDPRYSMLINDASKQTAHK